MGVHWVQVEEELMVSVSKRWRETCDQMKQQQQRQQQLVGGRGDRVGITPAGGKLCCK